MKIKIGNKIKEYATFREIRKEWIKDPEFRKASKELEFEFTLIRAILNARINKGLTQKKLAEKIGTKQSSIARFESGAYNPTLSFVQKLANALDVKIKIS